MEVNDVSFIVNPPPQVCTAFLPFGATLGVRGGEGSGSGSSEAQALGLAGERSGDLPHKNWNSVEKGHLPPGTRSRTSRRRATLSKIAFWSKERARSIYLSFAILPFG